MWRIAYNILLSILFPLFLLFSLTKRKIRKNLLERLFFSTKDYRIRDAIWIHAASVGEAAIGETLIEYMKSIKDISNFIVTTNTFYTKDMLKNRFKGQIAVFSLPFDFLWSVRHFINGSTFSALILIETEIWPNIIWEAKRKGIPVLIVNGRISDSTIKTYTRLSFFIRHVLSFVDFAICQSEEHKRRFISIGMNPAKTVTTGNLKYYRGIKETDREAKKERVITFGSIKEKELDTIYSVVRRLKENFPEYRVYIAPRDLFLVSNLEKELSPQFKTVKYSTLKEERDAPLDIVIVDTVGNLLEIYKKSEVAFVGGSLAPYGGQNMLEPLFFGTPVLFGPHVENFKEVAKLVLEHGAGSVVEDGESLYEKIEWLLKNEEIRKGMGKRGYGVIDMQRAVMEETASMIIRVIENNRYLGEKKNGIL